MIICDRPAAGVRFLRSLHPLTIAGFRTYLRMTKRIRPADYLFGDIGRLDHKIDALDQKFDRLCESFEQRLDRRFETVHCKMDDLRAELSKQFRWTFSTLLALLGTMVTVGAGVATALLRANP